MSQRRRKIETPVQVKDIQKSVPILTENISESKVDQHVAFPFAK